MTMHSDMRFVLALGLVSRARGLLGTEMDWGGGGRVLVLAPCRSVHTIGMGYALDIAFVDRRGIVLRAEHGVRPGRLLACRRATFVLERPHRSDATWLTAGDAVSCEIR